MTPMTRRPYSFAAERNSGSMAGRAQFSRGPRVSLVRPACSTRWWCGGATQIHPGLIGSLHGVSCRQWASLPEHLRQLARAASDVLNDEEGGRNLLPPTGSGVSQQPNSVHRRADDDNGEITHGSAPFAVRLHGHATSPQRAAKQKVPSPI